MRNFLQCKFGRTKFISEPDQGIYDAMNKGLNLATGDIVGILNSDDFYANNQVISQVVREFKNKSVDLVFADTVYVKPENLNRVVRYYSSPNFYPWKFAWGWMPAHPSCFLKLEVYEKYGHFKLESAKESKLKTKFISTNHATYCLPCPLQK